ncbi:MAG: HAMP domain-containing histidine kinase [Bdellovibrionales bacterium]|nr:HAMP domain-containing histidine kinase [Bdellovibrionales bacterium]
MNNFFSNSPHKEILDELVLVNPDEGNFSSFVESILRILNNYYADIFFELQIFNPRKRNLKAYSISHNKLEFKVIPYFLEKESERKSMFPINAEVNSRYQKLFPLVKDLKHIGFIQAIGAKEQLQEIEPLLFIFTQFILRAMVSSEKKMAVESLVELNVELEKIVEEKTESLMREKEAHFHASKMATLGEIAAGVAHEINNPLTIIQARILTLEKKMQKKQILDPEVAQDFEKMLGTVNRITKIIKGLKFISRDGQFDPPTRVSLTQLFQTTMDLCAERLKNNNILFEIENTTEDFEVEVRETQIVQVFLNLINNSFDAIKNLDSKWVKINFKINNELLSIHFKDSGYGISDDILEKIMNPFFTTKPAGQGTGLGLSISKGIVENHSGRLYCNRQTKHTEFIIEIPYVRKLTLASKSA